MKKLLSIGTVIAVATMVVIGGWAFGVQPGQAAGQADRQQGGMMSPDAQQRPPVRMAPVQKVTGAAGLFVLQGLTLSKYDANSMELLGTLELRDANAPQRPEMDAPPPPANDENQPAPPARHAPPPPPGALLLADSSLLVVIGNSYFNIDAASLTIKVQSALPDPRPAPPQKGGEQQNVQGQGEQRDNNAVPPQRGQGNPPPPPPPPCEQDGDEQNGAGNEDPAKGNGGPRRGPGHMPPPKTVLTLQGDNLLIERGHLLVTVIIADGTIVSQETVAIAHKLNQRD